RVPVAEGNFAVRSAARDSNRTALLLSAVEPIGKRIVRTVLIKLCVRLVIPGPPGRAAVHCDDRPLVAGEQNDLRVARIDPNVLIIVTTRGAAPAIPGLAAISRSPTNYAGRINDLRVLGIEPHDWQVAAADPAGRTSIF